MDTEILGTEGHGWTRNLRLYKKKEASLRMSRGDIIFLNAGEMCYSVCEVWFLGSRRVSQKAAT